MSYGASGTGTGTGTCTGFVKSVLGVTRMCGVMRVLLLTLILPMLAACRSVCAPQAVQPMHGPASCCPFGGPPPGALPAVLGEPADDPTNPVYWDGKQCRPLYRHCGCNSCIGDDCDDLYRSLSACQQAHASCR